MTGKGAPTSDLAGARARLEERLESIVRLCGEFCGVLSRERDAVVHGRADELVTVLQEKRNSLRRLAEAEASRRDGADALARALGLRESAPTLGRLAERLGEDGGHRLAEIKDRLMAAMRDIGALNQGNARLIRRAQYYNRHFLGLVQGPAGQTYGPDGNTRLGSEPILRKDL